MAPRNAKSARWRARNVEAWGDAQTPPCACGCGEPVGVSYDGPRMYVDAAHRYWHRQSSGEYKEMGRLGAERFRQGHVDIDAFRSALRKIKGERGWTWKELAEAGGWSAGLVSTYMHDKRYRGVGRDMARDFLRRLAGMAAPMSTHQLKMAKERGVREQKALSQIRNSYMRGGK